MVILLPLVTLHFEQRAGAIIALAFLFFKNVRIYVVYVHLVVYNIHKGYKYYTHIIYNKYIKKGAIVCKK